jgi:hypothetical protein
MKFIIFLLLPFFASAQSKTLKYEWKKISGPAQYSIESPAAAVTKITNLVAGIYQFELKVTNSKNYAVRDTMMLTVNPNPVPAAMVLAVKTNTTKKAPFRVP